MSLCFYANKSSNVLVKGCARNVWACYWTVHLVTADTGVAEVLNAFWSSVCQKKVSQASAKRIGSRRSRTASREWGLSQAWENSAQASPAWLHPRVKKELSDALKRSLANVFERSQRPRKVPYDGRKENVAPSCKKGRKNYLGYCCLVGVFGLWETFNRQKLGQEIFAWK